ncbi:MAG: site-specific integrase [Alphaproteobacteria bacterium]|nr:site-specific integrase [Alphaproteobacteria bacterium]
MKPTFKIFLRSDYPKKDGSIPVYLRILMNNKKKDYSTGVSVFEPDKYWDAKNRQVRRCSWVNMNYINSTIEDAENRAAAAFLDMRRNNIPFTIEEFDRRFKNPVTNQDCFYTFAKNQIEKMNNSSPDTKRSYTSYISKMKKFRPKLLFGELTNDFILQYREYMINKGNDVNTYNKALSWLKTQTKRARLEGIIKNDPFTGIKIIKVPGKRDFLTLEELTILENLYKGSTLKKGVQNALRVFLFFCYSGLRYMDAKKLKMTDLITEKHNGKDEVFIRIKQNKTGDWVSIPLPVKAYEMIGERFKNQTVMHVPCGQVMNRHLKTIAEQAGINKNLTFHVARHTFATCGISLGIPIEVISKLLGHTNLSTTMIYAKIMEQEKIKYQSRWDTYIPPSVTVIENQAT